jgi:hypothetical protein
VALGIGYLIYKQMRKSLSEQEEEIKFNHKKEIEDLKHRHRMEEEEAKHRQRMIEEDAKHKHLLERDLALGQIK